MSERPPVPGCDDFRRLANADHLQGGAEGVARLDPRPVDGGQVCEVTLRLRSGSVPPAMALTNRHRVLLSLLDPAVGAARLRLTYLLRHDAPLEVEVLIGLSSERAGATEPAWKAITKRSLEALSRIVFPGMATVNPSMSLCEGPTRRLRAPAVDAMRATAARNAPLGPVRITSTNEYALYLPNAGAASMAIDSALIGMAEAGIGPCFRLGFFCPVDCGCKVPFEDSTNLGLVPAAGPTSRRRVAAGYAAARRVWLPSTARKRP